MSEGILKIAIADASKLGLMKNLKTMTKMEPELYLLLFQISMNSLKGCLGKILRKYHQAI